MMKKLFFSLLFIFISFFGHLQTNPKSEVRAVWLTTIWNIDWPTTTGIAAQKAELIQKIDNLKSANYNTIYLQVRSRGDLIYPSTIEPWARSMTGTHGQNPGWDPLAFVIQACHERNMEVHAWFVTFNIHSGTSSIANTTPNHPKNAHPSWVVQYVENGTTLWWLNPGLPQVRDYLTSILVEMISNYDLDGVQFDYIRYPGQGFNDASTYSSFGNGMNIDDWRRENINKFVRQAYDTIQAIKPHIKLGSAPIGIYKNIPNGTGWEGFYEIYQDSRRWMQEGKHDYLCPQVYWDMSTNPQFNVVCNDWVQNSSGRHIYTGIASYRMESNQANWTATELLNQVNSTRANGAKGQSYFSMTQHTDNLKSIRTLLAQNQYQYPANIPNMPWKDNVLPNSPRNFQVSSVNNNTYHFSWKRPLLPSDNDTVKYYNVYASETSPVDISDIKKVVAFYVKDTFVNNITFNSSSGNAFFVVTAYDDGYNESAPSIEKNKNNISSQDGTAPISQVSISNNWQTGDFNAVFQDEDDSLGTGVNSCYYQVSYKKPLNYYWSATEMNGFYRDEYESNIVSGNMVSGDFVINNGLLTQRDETNPNTDLRIALNQNNENAYLYHWKAKISGIGINKRAGFHFMVDDAGQTSNRGNSYFIYLRTDDDKVQIYKVSNNVFALQEEQSYNLNEGQMYDVKVIFSKTTGEIIVYLNDVNVASWTDSSPYQIGNELSIRTGECKFEIDYLNVYHLRTTNSPKNITIGSAQQDDIQTLNLNPSSPFAQIKSICIDNSKNISEIDSVDVYIDTTLPSIDFVYDGNIQDEDTAFYTNIYRAKWLGYDNNSGIQQHYIAIGSTLGGTDVQDWVGFGQNLTYSTYNLNLTPGEMYYFSVKSVNNAGLEKILSSDGILIHPNATVGIGEINQVISKVVAYPNPFMDKIYIDFQETLHGKIKIHLLDSRGRKVISKKLTGTQNSIYELQIPSNLEHGNYILQLESEENKLLKHVYLIK